MGKESLKELIHRLIAGSTDSPSDFSAAFEETVDYFKKLHNTMEIGSEEEKKAAAEEYRALQKELDEAMKDMSDRSGLDPEYIKAMISNPQNFSEEQWKVMQESSETVSDISKDLNPLIEEQIPTPKEKKSRGKATKKWMKS